MALGTFAIVWRPMSSSTAFPDSHCCGRRSISNLNLQYACIIDDHQFFLLCFEYHPYAAVKCNRTLHDTMTSMIARETNSLGIRCYFLDSGISSLAYHPYLTIFSTINPKNHFQVVRPRENSPFPYFSPHSLPTDTFQIKPIPDNLTFLLKTFYEVICY